MPWEVVYHAAEPADWKVGDMWPAPEWTNSDIIGERYRTVYSKSRPPLMVVVPSVHSTQGALFLVDRRGHASPKGEGWAVVINGPLVVGQRPDVTLMPSINCVGSYHGYIRNGIIADDCEGRKYPGIDARCPGKTETPRTERKKARRGFKQPGD